MKLRNLCLSLALFLLINSCTDNPEVQQFKGYINQDGFEVKPGEIEVVFDEILSLPIYQIRTVINDEDSLLITFSGFSFGPFQYMLPGQGLNMATYYDASEGKYFSTHLSDEGFGEVDLNKENGKISGSMDLVMYDQSGDNMVVFSDISFSNLPFVKGEILSVSQYLRFLKSGKPQWSTSFESELNGSVINVKAKFSSHSYLHIEIPENLGRGTQPVGTGDVKFAIEDSLAYFEATGGEFLITEHHKELNYLEAEFRVERNPISQQNQRFRLTKGKIKFVYFE